MATVQVKHKFIHQAPRKLRLISDTVRGLPAATAVAELAARQQSASQIIRQAIVAAVAAAQQKGFSSSLFVTSIMVNEGPKLRRFIPMSRGRSQRILKRMSHLIVAVSDEPLKLASSPSYRAELAIAKRRRLTRQTKQPMIAEPSGVVDQPASKPAVVETEGKSDGSES